MIKIKSILPLGNIDDKHILVFGAGGQLGKEFQYLYEEEKFSGHYTFLIREQVDISDQYKVDQAIRDHQPDVVINCAAYTAVDRAESDRDKALLINAQAPETMANICRQSGAHFFHFSTDYVFDGTSATPYQENALTNPSGVYGATKLEGERRVMAAFPESYIFRTSWVYSMFGHNFVRTMLRLGKERDHLRIVDDQVGSPTWARDLARSVLTIIDQEHDLPSKSGIYHYSNLGRCSWYEFALKIFEIAGLVLDVEPIPTSGYPTPAFRPAFSLLDKSKFQQTFGLLIPQWEDSLKRCLREML